MASGGGHKKASLRSITSKTYKFVQFNHRTSKKKKNNHTKITVFQWNLFIRRFSLVVINHLGNISNRINSRLPQTRVPSLKIASLPYKQLSIRIINYQPSIPYQFHCSICAGQVTTPRSQNARKTRLTSSEHHPQTLPTYVRSPNY